MLVTLVVLGAVGVAALFAIVGKLTDIEKHLKRLVQAPVEEARRLRGL